MARPRFATKRKINMEKELGSLTSLQEKEKQFLKKGLKNKDIFGALPRPGSDDWLSSHKEQPQSVETWKKLLNRTVYPSRLEKNKIYLVPLDQAINTAGVSINKTGKSESFLILLQRFASIFFKGFEVQILPVPKKSSMPKFKTRINDDTGKPQLFIPDIYKYLESKFPNDAYCIVGITMVDLYPKESWNFVYGQALPGRGIGVFSFARYDPNFDTEEDLPSESPGTDVEPHTSTVVLWRSCKVMCHEICHLFCIMHCVYFSCAMNGSNHEEEANRRPMFLCPVCLLKLKSTKLNFDIKERYTEMLAFFNSIEDENFVRAAHWTEKVLALL